MSKRADVFAANKPKITEQEALTAIKARRTALSFNTYPFSGLVAFKFRLDDGTDTIIAIDQFAGTILRGLIEHLDAGKWKITQTGAPSGARRH